jgi:cell division protein FtsL
MSEIYTVKKIDNSRLVRPAASRFRDNARLVLFGGVLLCGCLFYGWQYFQCLELGYRLEELKAERGRALELNQQLKLEAAALRSPGRIDVLARSELGLTVVVPGQVAPPSAAAAEAVLAAAQRASDAAAR